MDESSVIEIAGKSRGFADDPSIQFALVFSALIHDADHQGVPNTQLLEEATAEAKMYQKSVAEQNAVHKAWGLLMEDAYVDLRGCIYSTEKELRQFRQVSEASMIQIFHSLPLIVSVSLSIVSTLDKMKLVVNVVLATDICDKELSAQRKSRWASAFSEDGMIHNHDDSVENRKATLVIEHLIQASDVIHTMQHWQIYLHWNEKFFFELFHAFKIGRSATDPSLGW